MRNSISTYSEIYACVLIYSSQQLSFRHSTFYKSPGVHPTNITFKLVHTKVSLCQFSFHAKRPGNYKVINHKPGQNICNITYSAIELEAALQ